MNRQIGVAILGGTGFGAGELLRLLVRHSAVQVVSVVSSSQAGSRVSDQHPHLQSFYDELVFDGELPLKSLENFEHQVVFAALPHGKSAEGIQALLARPGSERLRVIDLSGDFRLKNIQSRKAHYAESANSPLQDEFVYGLTEINRNAVVGARLVANPGCLSSACALAVLPLTTGEFVGSIVFDAKTGTSGAGKTPSETKHHPLRNSSMTAYKVLEHRHEPEILEAIGDIEGSRIETVFVPHLLPSSRGIYATAYLKLPNSVTTAELTKRYEQFFANSPFVRIRKKPPELADVLGSNFCDISVCARGRQVVAMAALDNLVKGMAGQAIQNLNLMTGLPESFGIWAPGLGPI